MTPRRSVASVAGGTPATEPSPSTPRRAVAAGHVPLAMLRAGLLPAAITALTCLAVAGIGSGAAAAGAAAIGGVVVLVALSVGPGVVALTHKSSPSVTFVAAVLGYVTLVWTLGLLLVVLIEVPSLRVVPLAVTLGAGVVAGAAGMVVWSFRARIPVYGESGPHPAEGA